MALFRPSCGGLHVFYRQRSAHHRHRPVMPDSGRERSENFPHLACTLGRSCVCACAELADTQPRRSVHARWGKFSSAPVSNLASLAQTRYRIDLSSYGTSCQPPKLCYSEFGRPRAGTALVQLQHHASAAPERCQCKFP